MKPENINEEHHSRSRSISSSSSNGMAASAQQQHHTEAATPHRGIAVASSTEVAAGIMGSVE
jgi:hypothetical protein